MIETDPKGLKEILATYGNLEQSKTEISLKK